MKALLEKRVRQDNGRNEAPHLHATSLRCFGCIQCGSTVQSTTSRTPQSPSLCPFATRVLVLATPAAICRRTCNHWRLAVLNNRSTLEATMSLAQRVALCSTLRHSGPNHTGVALHSAVWPTHRGLRCSGMDVNTHSQTPTPTHARAHTHTHTHTHTQRHVPSSEST